jgi:hypothetical protein
MDLATLYTTLAIQASKRLDEARTYHAGALPWGFATHEAQHVKLSSLEEM